MENLDPSIQEVLHGALASMINTNASVLGPEVAAKLLEESKEILETTGENAAFVKMHSIWDKAAGIIIDVQNKINKQTEVVYTEEIGKLGDLFTKEDFIRDIKSNCLIDDDGWGDYSNGTHISNISVRPSEVLRNGWDDRFTHILWYNR